MTGLELATATANRLGVVVFVFGDGELAQISQAQEIPYNRKTCTVLGPLDVAGVAQATGAAFVRLHGDGDIERGLEDAFAVASTGRPVLVDVAVDYTKRTRFTDGIVRPISRASTSHQDALHRPGAVAAPQPRVS